MLKWMFATATQGSADAFAETEFATGLSAATRTAFRIRRIEFYLPALAEADSNIQLVLRRNSAAAIAIAGSAVIASIWRQSQITTSGAVIQEISGPTLTYTYAKDEEFLVVEESLFLDIDSAGTSASNAGSVRIGYETRQITENERLQIMTATAS